MLYSPPPRVLCVDDDVDSRLMLVTLLRLASIESKAVPNAVQALSLMQTEHFDLFMLDARLPEVDGFDLCRRLRAFDPHIPILFFSGAAYEADKRKALAAGADAYVAKPDIYEMMESVKQLTSHAAERAAAQVSLPLAERLIVTGQAIPAGQVGIP